MGVLTLGSSQSATPRQLCLAVVQCLVAVQCAVFGCCAACAPSSHPFLSLRSDSYTLRRVSCPCDRAGWQGWGASLEDGQRSVFHR